MRVRLDLFQFGRRVSFVAALRSDTADRPNVRLAPRDLSVRANGFAQARLAGKSIQVVRFSGGFGTSAESRVSDDQAVWR